MNNEKIEDYGSQKFLKDGIEFLHYSQPELRLVFPVCLPKLLRSL